MKAKKEIERKVEKKSRENLFDIKRSRKKSRKETGKGKN